LLPVTKVILFSWSLSMYKVIKAQVVLSQRQWDI
jgi:hypothetical protein